MSRDRELAFIIDSFEIASEVEDLQVLADRLPPVRPGERVAVSLAPKSAALTGDRVWSGSTHDEVPSGLQCFGGSQEEIAFVLVNLWHDFATASGLSHYHLMVGDLFTRFGMPTHDPDSGLRIVTEALRAALRGATAVPMHLTAHGMRSNYPAGEQPSLVVRLAPLQVPRERALSWPQVLEFRRDEHACASYRRLLRWPRQAMTARPAAPVDEVIGSLVADAAAALTKHGVATGPGALEAVIDADSVTLNRDVFARMVAGPVPLPSGAMAHLREDRLDLGDRTAVRQPEVALTVEPEHQSRGSHPAFRIPALEFPADPTRTSSN